MTKIALLDLNHQSLGVHTITVPLSSGILAAYLRQQFPGSLDIRIFKEGTQLEAALSAWVPEIVGLAQYAWNSELNLYYARRIRERNPEVLVVAGGPNLHHEPERRVAFLQRERVIDVCVAFDGEIPLAGLVRRVLDGASRDELRDSPVDGTFALAPGSDELRDATALRPRLASLDELGSLYADGVFDEFLDQGHLPFVQTHRGCPFTCTFCHTGHAYHAKMLFQSVELFRRDMEALAQRFAGKVHIPLIMANTNMSLFRQDFEIARVLREMRERYSWPQIVKVCSGKDPERLLEMMHIIDYMPCISLQSMDPQVLTNIRRRNIPFEDYVRFQKEVQNRTGSPSSTELVMNLPGESRQTFLDGIRRILNSGVHNICIYTLMSLPGTVIGSAESERQYQYDKRFRLVPRQFSRIAGELILDVEEVIVGTNTLSYEDYLDIRGLCWVINTFFGSVEVAPVRRLLQEHGVEIAQWVFDLHRTVGTSSLAPVYEGFMRETAGELFPSLQALREHFQKAEHARALESGDVGDNLVRKYKCVALAQHFREVVRLAVEAAKALVPDRLHPLYEELLVVLKWRDLGPYLEHQGPLGAEVALRHDVPRWLAEGTTQLEALDRAPLYRVEVEPATLEAFEQALTTNRERSLSLQILYRDHLTSRFWPRWCAVSSPRSGPSRSFNADPH